MLLLWVQYPVYTLQPYQLSVHNMEPKPHFLNHISLQNSCLQIRGHMTGIWLATGVVCISCLISIYIEWGVLPLYFWRDLLLCSYAIRFVVYLHHLSYSAVFTLNLHYRYEISLIMSRPVGIHFQQWLESLCVNLHELCPTYMFLFSLWCLPQPSCDLTLVKHGKEQNTYPSSVQTVLYGDIPWCHTEFSCSRYDPITAQIICQVSHLHETVYCFVL
jgi:hypothetical protein